MDRIKYDTILISNITTSIWQHTDMIKIEENLFDPHIYYISKAMLFIMVSSSYF